jgi:glycine oxidase
VADPRNIVVVGAGIVGCAVAYELARRGASVDVVDMRAAGMGATQASAGILAPYIEARETSPLFALAVRSFNLFDEFVASVSRDSGIAIPYRRTGTLDVATDDKGVRALSATAAVLSRLDVPAELVDGAAAHALEPFLAADVIGGLLIPSHGFVSAPELTRALAGAARHHGARIVEHGTARRIARDGGEVVVETDRGRLIGSAVVLAAGSWSGSIEIEGVAERLPVRPIRGQLLYLRWTGTTLRRVIWSARCYLVPWDDGTLLVGATSEDAGFDERATAAGVRDLLEAACEVVPRGWTAQFLGARAGLRPASSDELPIIGASRVMPNLIYATGHYRNGILLAPLTATLVADAILDDRADAMLAVTNPQRFGDL